MQDRYLPFNIQEVILNAKYQAKIFNSKFPITQRDLHQLTSLYDKKIQYVDKKIGEFCDELDELRLLDEVYLIITSDHGEEFLEHGALGHLGVECKTHMYNELIKVPLIIFGVDTSERVVNENASLIDLGPTILSLFSIPYGKYLRKMDGRSLIINSTVSLMNKRAIFSEADSINLDSGFKRVIDFRSKKIISIIKEHWKYIYNEEDKSVQLFYLKRDPSEKENLIYEEREIADALHKELLLHLRREEKKWKLAQRIINMRKNMLKIKNKN